MIGKIAGVMVIVAVLFAVVCGNVSALSTAVLDGAESAVTLTVALCGMMCLWGGILQVLKDAGMITRLARLIRPVLRLFFPEAARHDEVAGEIAANMAANLLGVGNAATPSALSAMRGLQEINPHPDRASDDMITLAVMNTAPLSLIPSTVLTLLRAAGASDPFSVILPIWLTSSVTALVALLLCRIAALTGGIGEREAHRAHHSPDAQRHASESKPA